MNSELVSKIVALFHGGASVRRIALSLGVSRRTVHRALGQVEQARGAGPPERAPRPATARAGKLDAYEPAIADLLARYPDISVRRIHEELRRLGYTGGCTVLSERVLRFRPSPVVAPVRRFETAPGEQAQMDYSTYDLDFTDEGRRRIYAFSYVLGYSRRQYLRFVESQDFATTVREHIRGFEHLGGVAATCLYDNMKVVVSGYDGDDPVYNPRFLAFAAHYGFRPVACRPRRPQTKGKVERPFGYVESSLLGGRTFRGLEHLNETAAWWLAEVADVRVHRQTKARHRLFPRTAAGERSPCKDHEPPRDAQRRSEQLTPRFAEFGATGTRFLEGLLAGSRFGKNQAERVLSLAAAYPRADVLSALERAVRYGAFSLLAMQRILAARGRPKTPLDALADDHQSYLDRLLEGEPTPPRPTSDYQALLGEGPHDDEATDLGSQAGSETPNPSDEGNGVTELA
jgi:transposase